MALLSLLIVVVFTWKAAWHVALLGVQLGFHVVSPGKPLLLAASGVGKHRTPLWLRATRGGAGIVAKSGTWLLLVTPFPVMCAAVSGG